jgi:sporulation protein YlmC with PRC-barrel domain
MIVKGQQGEELGRVQDLVVDPRGYVSFAVISHGGFLGWGEKLVAIPFSALKFDRTGRSVVVDASKEKFDTAPAFRVSDLSNEKWAADDYRFFGQRPYWTEEEVPTQETSPSQGKSSKNSTENEYPYTPLVPF